MSSAEYVGTFAPGSDEWHAARANGLGGSEIAAVLGLSRWESRYSLWLRKKGLIPPQVESPVMEAGKRLEPVILQWWSDQHPDCSVMLAGTYRHPDRRWQVANPDLFAAEPCSCGDIVHDEDCKPEASSVVEAKFALYPDDWGKPGTDEIPIYYRCQVQWYLDVLGLDTAYVAVFIGSQGEFREYVVHADPEDQAVLRAAGEEFMASLAADERPDIDEHSATYSAIRQLPDGVDDEPVEIPGELVDQYVTTTLDAKRAVGAKRKASALILDALGNHRKALCLGEHVATRAVKPDGTTHSLKPARGLVPDDEDAA